MTDRLEPKRRLTPDQPNAKDERGLCVLTAREGFTVLLVVLFTLSVSLLLSGCANDSPRSRAYHSCIDAHYKYRGIGPTQYLNTGETVAAYCGRYSRAVSVVGAA